MLAVCGPNKEKLAFMQAFFLSNGCAIFLIIMGGNTVKRMVFRPNSIYFSNFWCAVLLYLCAYGINAPQLKSS